MRVTVFILMYFSLMIVGFLMGMPSYGNLILSHNASIPLDCNAANYQASFDNTTNQYNFTPAQSEQVAAYAKCQDNQTVLGAILFWIALTGVAAYFLSFSAIYIIPLLMVYAIITIVGYLFVPINILLDTAPPEMRAIILIGFTIINLLMVLSFVRQGGV